MRGNPANPLQRRSRKGSIPAHAGEPSWNCPTCSKCRVYPRTCGGTLTGLTAADLDAGLSPHMRGNLTSNHSEAGAQGSIPAHAGEPRLLIRHQATVQVYPRTCGGTWVCEVIRRDSEGLSPHMRGNQQPGAAIRQARRSIPAHAGEPTPTSSSTGSATVYPRTCGGTVVIGWFLALYGGLSPHMRGNRPR